MIVDTLKKFGMTEKETKVYLILLKGGSLPSGQIISKTGFQSSVVYHLLGTLIEKGFVSFVTEKKKKLFSASDPQALNILLEQKEKELAVLKESFKSDLRELETIRDSSKEETKITIYKGIKGIQGLFNDLLKNAKEFKSYSTRDNFAKAMPKYREYFREMRAEKKIRQKSIITDDKRKPNNLYQEKRYVPKEYASPIGLQVYNNKVMIIIWEAEPPIALVLEGEKVSKTFNSIFETMWKQAKK